jgi:hypothetical protein
MKYAIIGPKGYIRRVTEGEPSYKAEDAIAVPISDDQAAAIKTGRSSVPPVIYIYKKDKLVTVKEFIKERMAKLDAEQKARKAERKAQREAGERSKPKPDKK